MSTAVPEKAARAPSRRLRLWLAAALVGALVGLLGIPETALRSFKSTVLAHPVKPHVAIVAIDDKSLAAIGQWPFPRSLYATLIDRLFEMGAKRVFINLDFSSRHSPAEDRVFAEALARHRGRVFLTSRVVKDEAGRWSVISPVPEFAAEAEAVEASLPWDRSGGITQVPYVVGFDGNRQSLSAKIAGSFVREPSEFAIDTSISERSVPILSVSDILKGQSESAVRGKQAIIGATSEQLQDMFSVAPYNRISSSMIFALGAETLFEGVPADLGWLPLYAFAIFVMYFVLLIDKRMIRIGMLLALFCLVPVMPLLLPSYIVIAVSPCLSVLVLGAAWEGRSLLRDALRSRATVNQVSGLLNLIALRQLEVQPNRRLVAAHIHNFAEVTASLPPEEEATLIAQIASRLKFGIAGGELYHGDNGVFAWFADDDRDAVGEGLDALYSLFRAPVRVGDRAIDLVVTFGLDTDGERSVANRLGSALVAAAEASAEGGKWRAFDKATLADAAWKLSLLSQLDAAIDDGHLWVAYQPKLDLVSRRLIGAEALVRWTHPEKGAISPIEFVAAAEQHNRIEKLTLHVLDRAVLACATINAHGIPFGIAVNLSTRLLEDRSIVAAVAASLAAHRLDADRLTLEITETATLTSATSLDVLGELRALGIRISIDDYGTGLSTLDYLKKIPASEIKIDRSFVQSMLGGGSDLLMVNSTIQLAHSLGHVVVAEGVETDEVLARLAELQCDIAQGYRIGRPMTFQDLARRLLAEKRHAA